MENITTFERLLDLNILEKNEGTARIRMPYRSEITNPTGVIHGGAISSLADAALFYALASKLNHWDYCTIKLDIEFKLQASTDLVAHAKIVDRKRNVYIGQAEIRDSEDRLVAKASGKYFVFNMKSKVS